MNKKTLFAQLKHDSYTKHKDSIIKFTKYNDGKKEREYISSLDYDKFEDKFKDESNFNRWWYFDANYDDNPYNYLLCIIDTPPTLDSSGYNEQCPFCMMPEEWEINKRQCGNVWAYHPKANIVFIHEKYSGLNTDNEFLMKNYIWLMFQKMKMKVIK